MNNNENQTTFGSQVKNLGGQIRIFFATLGGCDRETISRCPSGDINVKASLGVLMLMVCILAGIGMANMAPMFVSNVGIIIAIAILWAGFILSLDRGFISGMDRNYANGGKRNWFMDIGMMIVRFTFIFFTSYLVAISLEIQIFKTEIDKVIVEKARIESVHVKDSIKNEKSILYAELDAAKMRLDNASGKQNDYLESIRAEVDALSDSVRAQEQAITGEIEGLIGSGKKGYGPAAKKKEEYLESEKQRLAAMQAEYERLRMESPSAVAFAEEQQKYKRFLEDHKKDLAELEKAETEALKSVSDNTTYGFQDRFDALKDLKSGNNSFLIWAVWFMIFLIETSPILMKLMIKPGVYENQLKLSFEEHYAGEYQDTLTASAKKIHDGEVARMNNEKDMFELSKNHAEARAENLAKEAESITKEYEAKEEIMKAKISFLTKLVTKKNSVLQKINEFTSNSYAGKKEMKETQEKMVRKFIKEFEEN